MPRQSHRYLSDHFPQNPGKLASGGWRGDATGEDGVKSRSDLYPGGSSSDRGTKHHGKALVQVIQQTIKPSRSSNSSTDTQMFADGPRSRIMSSGSVGERQSVKTGLPRPAR